jgi:nicotinate-nucleotide adenylyltransferase
MATQQTTRVALFGGSFDPPHLSHVMATALALTSEQVDRILVVPCFSHYFDKPLTPFHHRLEMCRMAFALFGPAVTISPVEEELGGINRTLDTLRHLAGIHPEWSLRLLIGGDIPAEREKWHRFDEIERLAPPLVVGRSGYEAAGLAAFKLPPIASREIRRLTAAGGDLAGMVPEAVARYIQQQGLYT